MRDLVEWTPEVPAERIVSEAREILLNSDWDKACKVATAGKVGQRAAQIFKMRGHVKALKQSTLWAERKMGELLNDMERAKTGRPKKTSHDVTIKNPPILADLGVTRKQASRLQKMTKVSEKTFEQIIDKSQTAAAIFKVVDKADASKAPPPVKNDTPESTADATEPVLTNPAIIETIKIFLQLVRNHKINTNTVFLFLCYWAYGSTSPIQAEITEYTGISSGAIARHKEVLKILGGIKQEKIGRHTKVEVFNISTPSPTTISLIKSILDLSSQEEYTRRTSSKYTSNKGNDGFTTEDIEADEDYQKAKVSLDKYFEPFEIDPVALTRKSRFSKLIDLIQDDTFDFEAYCKWFHIEKYEATQFNFGIFLYPSVIKAFKKDYKREGQYLRTSSNLQNSESFKKGVKKTHEFIKELVKKDKEEPK